MTETQVLVINADLPDIDHPLAIGSEPEMFKLAQHNYKSGEWPFPVRLVTNRTRQWNEEAYLNSLNINKIDKKHDTEISLNEKYAKIAELIVKEAKPGDSYRSIAKRTRHSRSLLNRVGLQAGISLQRWRAIRVSDKQTCIANDLRELAAKTGLDYRGIINHRNDPQGKRTPYRGYNIMRYKGGYIDGHSRIKLADD